MTVNLKLISALLAAFGYRYNTKEGAREVVIDLQPIDGKVIPPFARGQRA